MVKIARDEKPDHAWQHLDVAQPWSTENTSHHTIVAQNESYQEDNRQVFFYPFISIIWAYTVHKQACGSPMIYNVCKLQLTRFGLSFIWHLYCIFWLRQHSLFRMHEEMIVDESFGWSFSSFVWQTYPSISIQGLQELSKRGDTKVTNTLLCNPVSTPKSFQRISSSDSPETAEEFKMATAEKLPRFRRLASQYTCSCIYIIGSQQFSRINIQALSCPGTIPTQASRCCRSTGGFEYD